MTTLLAPVAALVAEPGSPVRARQSGLPDSGAAAVFAEVLRQTDRGLTAGRVAARLGVPDELVALALDHAERLGLVVRPAAGSSCGGACPAGPTRPVACAGCPLAH